MAALVLFAGIVFPRCCCEAARADSTPPHGTPAGCCGEPAPAEEAPCPSGGECALEGCVKAPEAAVRAQGTSTAPAATPRCTAAISLEVPPPTVAALSPLPAPVRAEAVPKRHMHCVYRI